MTSVDPLYLYARKKEHTEHERRVPGNPVFAKCTRFSRAKYDNTPTNLYYFRSFGKQIMLCSTSNKRPILRCYVS